MLSLTNVLKSKQLEQKETLTGCFQKAWSSYAQYLQCSSKGNHEKKGVRATLLQQPPLVFQGLMKDSLTVKQLCLNQMTKSIFRDTEQAFGQVSFFIRKQNKTCQILLSTRGKSCKGSIENKTIKQNKDYRHLWERRYFSEKYTKVVNIMLKEQKKSMYLA